MYVCMYYKNCDAATVTYRALRRDYGLHNRSTTQAIGKIVRKFKETGMVTTIERPMHHRFARSAENIAIVGESVAEDLNVSISQELGVSYGLLWRILHSELHLYPYKVQLKQQLKPSAMNHISHAVGMLINKIVLFGILRILK